MPHETPARTKARHHLAQSFKAMGSAYGNLAGLIMTPGYESFWVTPALDALCPLVLLFGDADDDEAAPASRTATQDAEA